MQVKHLYMGISSFLLGAGSAFGATLTAESAYFRVDTTAILLSASDGSVPGGIEVKWTDGGSAQYELFRGLSKSGPFNRIALVSTSAYFDFSVEWGRPYWYYVSPLAAAKSAAPKGRGASNVDDGMAQSDGELPNITKVEFPEFWLLQDPNDDKGNPIRIHWNAYDSGKYRVSGFSVTATRGRNTIGPISYRSDESNPLKNPTSFDFLGIREDAAGRRIGSAIKVNAPGEWQVSVSWTVDEIVEGADGNKVYRPYKPDSKGKAQELFSSESRNQKVTVYFEKYESQFGKPNWWYWWQNADQADIKYLKEFKYDSKISEKNYAGQCRSKYKEGENPVVKFSEIAKTPPVGFPCIYRLKSDTFAPEYLVSDLAPCAGEKYSAKANGYQGREVGSDHVGIAALASVIAHERKHGEIKADLYNHEGMYLFQPKDWKTAKKSFTKVSDVIDELRVQQKDAPSFQINDYLSKVLEADSSGDVITDFDCDGVRDDWEVSKYNSLPNEPDTFGFRYAASSFDEYAAYGDNEVLAREAETKPVQFNASKDYAIPGINRLSELQHLTKKNLESAARYKNELSKSQFSTTSKMARGVKNPAGDSLTEESIQAYSGVAESLPEVTDYTDVSGVSISRIGCVPPCANTNGLYESLQYCITLTNAQDMSVRVDVKGYLVDAMTNVVAWAESFFEAAPNGISTVNLVFDGRILSGVQSTGFSLRCLTVHAVSEWDPPLYASQLEVEDSQVDIASSAFAKYELRLLSETASLFPVWSSNGTCRINFVCDVENNCGAAYYIRARLEDSSGIFLTEAQSATFVSNVTNTVSVTFDSSDIYLAYRNGGDLEISSLWLVREDIGTVEIANKIAVMPEVPRESFRTEENFLSIPEDVAVAATVSRGTDGLVDALSFSFDVESALDMSETCNIWGTLSNTNGDICATEIVPYVFRKGTNTVTLSFSGVTIGSSGHDGPYVLSDVQFRMSDSGRTIECMTSAHDAIDLKVSDFGGVPFTVKGEPQYRMTTDDSPAAVVVTVDVARPDTITATVLLVDGEGQYVATARTVETVSAVGERTLTLVFDPNEINASGRRGPYTISYLLLKSGIEGVADIRVEDFEVRDVGDSVLKVFVDAATGDDANDGATTATAKRTIQAAVEAIEADGDRVVVADGVYEPFTCANKRIVIESVNGSRYTIIDGGGANRCATLGTSGGQTNTVLRGFTLRNGNANASGVNTARQYGGGAYGGTLENCVVANCEAQYGGGICDANLTNCSIVGNRAYNGANNWRVYGGGIYWKTSGLSASSCYIAENRAREGSAVYTANGVSGLLSHSLVARNTALNCITLCAATQYGLHISDCTVADNNCAPNYYPGTSSTVCWDSIIHGNYKRGWPDLFSNNSRYDSLTNCCTTVYNSTSKGTGIVTDLPAFVDRAGRIYDLLAPSGENIVGAGQVVDTNGRFKVSVSIDGFGVVTRPGAVVASGSAFELVAEETGRAFEGFYTNGVFATANRALELMDIQSDIHVTARFAKRTAYVAETGNDANDGLSSATAKRTIHAALPLVENGEAIEVGPGTYVPIAPTGYDPKGKSIHIYSTHGAAQTIIDGGRTNRCADLSDNYSGTTNAVLRGFTLRNGYTTASGGGAYYGMLIDCVVVGNEAVYSGGGAYYSRLENCIVVRNSAGTHGGGLYACTANRSTICGNTADGYGGGTYSGTLSNSIIYQNSAGTGYNGYNGSFNTCCTSPNRGANPVLGDPLLVDGWNGDARLRVGSPCFVDGVQVCGADVGDPVEGVSVSVGVQGTGVVSNATFLVSNGDSVTIAAEETLRPFLYWDIDGELVVDRVYTLTNVTADVRAMAVFGTFDWFVDVAAGDDANDGFGWGTAKRTLQAAIDEAVDGETIYVEAGTYAPISTGNKRVRIESLYGAEATILDGGGTNRCATLAVVGIQTNSAIIGFTLLNGHAQQYGGGAYGGTLDGCVISNCVAGKNVSEAYGGGAYGGALNNCLVVFNSATASYGAEGGGTYRTRLRSCTIARNSAKGVSGYAHGGGVYGDSYSAYNTIVWDNDVDAPAATYPNVCYAYLYNCCSDDTAYYRQDGTITADPQFVDAAAGNFRLKAGSPCLNAGNNSYVQGETDLDWADRIQDGRVDMGCYEGAAYGAPPGQVTGLQAVRGVLTWNALPDAEGYMIYRSTRRAASSATYIGTSDVNAYTDETAEEGTAYYYWVQAFNALGLGSRSALAENTWPVPLAVTTTELPKAMEKVDYAAQLEATGGMPPYAWRTANGYVSVREGGTYVEDGTAQGWHADDDCWTLELPFDFPFYGNTYRTAYVNSNGTISFDGLFDRFRYSLQDFTNHVMVAAMWADLMTSGTGDIFVSERADAVTIRWACRYLDDGEGEDGNAVAVSATLAADGTIRLAYGEGNAYGGFVGVSAGDGARYLSLGDELDLNAASDLVLMNGGIGNGLTLTEGGLIVGTPTTAGTNTFAVTVTDAAGETAERMLTLVVDENPNRRPVVESVRPATNVNVKVGTSATFAVTAHDPEGEPLSYAWLLDGEEVECSAAQFTFAATADTAGAHTLECVVSDGFWTDEVRQTWTFRVVRDWYVDAAAEEDAGDGTSADSALPGIDWALEMALEGDTIHVAPGVYQNDYMDVGFPVSIVATEGPRRTFLRGGRFYGPDEWRPGRDVRQPSLDGFTLVGDVDVGSVTLRNCVITSEGRPPCPYLFACRLFDCVVTEVVCDETILGQCELTRCTVAGNTVGEYGAVGEDCSVSDSIVWGNVTLDGEVANYDTETYWDWDGEEEVEFGYVQFAHSCTWPMPVDGDGAGIVTNDPRLVDAVNGDVRVRAGSPCLDADGVQTMGVVLGAPVEGHVLSVRIEGNGAVSPLTAIVPTGGTATFAVADGARPFLGFTTNGVFATGDATLVWPGVAADGLVTAAFSNFTFHVDAATGNDAADGLSWETPKASIQSAIDAARRGETIRVKPGRYGPITTEDRATSLRIASVGGKSVTVIDGDGTNRCAALRSPAYSWAFDATLSGFTVTNGYAYSGGGGVWGGTVEDCDVVGNVARGWGGGIEDSRAIRCRILGNAATQDGSSNTPAGGGAAHNSTLFNCLVAGNVASAAERSALGGGTSYSILYNCTVVDNAAESEVSASGGGVQGGSLYNTVVYGNTVATGVTARVAQDVAGLGSWAQYNSLVGADPGFADAANGDYRLTATSPCIDAGSNSHVKKDDLDLDGNARIQHYTVDIGCYEYALATPVRDAAADFAAQMAGTCHGIFVGVGEYTYTSSLFGCVPDATNMQARCIAKGYWHRTNTVAFLDAAATKAAVRAKLAALAVQAAPGDTVLYYQSSHGGNHMVNGEMTKDTYICLHDAEYEDDEMAADLMRFAAGVKVVIVLDTCHSAGMFKAVGARRAPAGSFAQRVHALMAARAAGRKGAKAGITADDIGWIAAADYNQYSWDTATGGAFTLALLDGWRTGEADVDGDGRLNFHELWRYAKGIATGYSGMDATDAQCLNEAVLLSRFAGIPDAAGAVTTTTPVPVPHVWLDAYPELLAASGGDYEALANAPSPGAAGAGKRWADGTPCCVWQDFVAGTAPTDDALFTATIRLEGATPVVGWWPDTPALRATRVYRTFGKKALGDAEWVDVSGGNPSEYRFFKVTVDLP